MQQQVLIHGYKWLETELVFDCDEVAAEMHISFVRYEQEKSFVSSSKLLEISSRILSNLFQSFSVASASLYSYTLVV